MTPAPAQAQFLILYDGVCALCNGWVKFVLRFDRNEKFQFAALQSEYARGTLARRNVSIPELSSIVLVLPNEVYTRSDAALSILAELSFPWSIFVTLKIIPRFLRDAVYNFVAAIRYPVFGKYDVCPIPAPEVRKRFLDQK